MSKEIVDMNKEMASCSLNKRNINKEMASCSVNKSKKMDRRGLPGVPCRTRLIFVDAGKDIISSIYSVTGSHNVHIIGALGDVSNVTLLHPADVGSTTFYTTTYCEGVSKMTMMTGTFLKNDDAMANVTVSITGKKDGKIRGGVVVGQLRAASPIEVMTGFMRNVEDDD